MNKEITKADKIQRIKEIERTLDTLESAYSDRLYLGNGKTLKLDISCSQILIFAINDMKAELQNEIYRLKFETASDNEQQQMIQIMLDDAKKGAKACENYIRTHLQQ